MSKVLVTGVAGFIGYHLVKKLVAGGHEVLGIDDVNSYYDPAIKHARLQELEGAGFSFRRVDIADSVALMRLLPEIQDVEYVVHLAAQAGVRYSLINPEAYIHSNIMGQMNMLELARKMAVIKHFVYASSSSVYGRNEKTPFSENDTVDRPASLYAVTKRSCELMAHNYAETHGIQSTGLRFFTVYGPNGRPDMTPWLFTDKILKGKPIDLYNHGKLARDFTYIDDIIAGVVAVMKLVPAGHDIYNLGNHSPVAMVDFIHIIEEITGKKAEIILKPAVAGDVEITYADITKAQAAFGYSPKTDIRAGLVKFVEWFLAR